MNNRTHNRASSPASLLLLAAASLLAMLVAVYAAACHCGGPNSEVETPDVGSAAAARSTAESDRSAAGSAPLALGGGKGQGLGVLRSALTVSASSDTDFLTANRGYGIVEDTSVSAGIIRRTLGLPNFGLANANPTVEGWQSTTALTIARHGHGTVILNGRIYVIGGDTAVNVFTDDVSFAPVKADGTVSAWDTTQKLPKPIWAPAAVAQNGVIYVIGGNSSGALTEVYSAKPNPDGSIATWQLLTAMTKGRESPAAAVHNGTVYVTGGRNGGSYYNDVEYAKIMPDGSLSGWIASASTFTTGRLFHSSITDRGGLYVVGGKIGTNTYTDKIQYAPLNADGSLGAWSAEMTLPGVRHGHVGVAYNGNLYVYGGFTSSYSADVLFAPLNGDGTVGTWNSTTSLTSARNYLGGIISNGFVYSVGGFTSSAVSEVLFAPIRPNGEVGKTWVKTTDFQTPRYGHSSALYNGYLYVVGGKKTASTYLNDVQYAPIYGDGTLGSWSSSVNTFASARTWHRSAVNNGFLYVIGGYGGSYFGDVQYAPLNADGSTGVWKSTTALPKNPHSHAVVVNGNYLYVLGGYTGSYLTDVIFAPLNSDGTVGNWSSTTSFGTGRYGHTSVTWKNYIYLVGGHTNVCLSDVQYAPINVDGTVGTWQTTTALPACQWLHASVVMNGYIYVFGGDNFGPKNSVLYAKINSDGTVGSWSSSTSFSTARTRPTGELFNGFAYVIGGDGGSTFLTNAEFAPINANGTVGEWNKTTSISGARRGHTSVAHDDVIYSLGGYGGSLNNDVQYSKIEPDGHIRQWSQTAAFNTARYVHASTVHNGYVLLLGGNRNLDIKCDDVQSSNILPDGTLGGWSTTVPFSPARGALSSVATNGHVYLIGGCSGTPCSTVQSDVQYAQLNSNGTIGAWSQTTPLPLGRWLHSVNVFGDKMFVSGGCSTSNCSTIQSDVLVAQIRGDGTVGDWTLAASLPTSRCGHVNSMFNGYFMVYGGCSAGFGPCTTILNDVQIAAMNNDGSLGNWKSVQPFADARCCHSGVALYGFQYLLGGGNDTSYFSDVQYAPITAYSTSSKSSFSKQFDLGALGRFNSIKLDGTLGGVNSELDVSYRIAGVDAVYGAWTTPVAVTALPGTVPVSSGDGRYIEVSVTIDDNGRLGVTSGMGSSEVSELSIDYSAADGQTCAVAGDCVSGNCIGLVCCSSACNTPNQCQTAGTCASGTCIYGSKANTVACDDGSNDTKNDKCDGSGGCAGTTYTCTPAVCEATSVTNGTDCTVTYKVNTIKCADAVGQCWQDLFCTGSSSTCPASQPKANTISCNDNDDCTHTDKCDGAGGCAGTAYSCPAPTQCQASVTCDGAGGCPVVNKLVSDGCSTGDSCSTNDHCDGNGNCVSGGVNPACVDAGTTDTGPADTGILDAGEDAGQPDGGVDAGEPDGGVPDAGPVDTGSDASNPSDASQDAAPDTGAPDAGTDGGDAGADVSVEPGADAGRDTGLPAVDSGGPGVPDAATASQEQEIIGDMYSCSCATVSTEPRR